MIFWRWCRDVVLMKAACGQKRQVHVRLELWDDERQSYLANVAKVKVDM